MDQLVLSPLKENGVNVGQVGTIWPDDTIIEAAVNLQESFLEDVTRLRDLSQNQPDEVEDILSLSYAAPLDLNREKVEHLLRYFMDILRSKENAFRDNRQPKVMAHVLLRILRYINHQKYPGLDESRWPISPFFMRAIRSIIRKVSKFEGCAFLKKSMAWRGVRWYLRELEKMVKENWLIDQEIREECQWAIQNVNIANEEGYDL